MLESLLEVMGRLHPMVLHMPIGILGALVACELLAIIRRKPLDVSIRRTLALLAGASGIVSAASGLQLSLESTYGGDTLQLHKWLGIGLAVGTVLTAVLSLKSKPAAYGVMLFITAGVLVPAGHFGAEMTHGKDFVLAPLRAKTDPLPAAPTLAADASFYQAKIAPILAARCVNCHSESRQKAKLALDTPEGILAGGESGSAIEPGDPKHSEILVRMKMPLEHKHHMPPKEKGQPTADEIAAIEKWIADGASFDAAGAEIGRAAEPPPAPVPDPVPPPLPKPSPEALARLTAAQIHAQTTDPESGMLWITFAAVPETTDGAAIALLSPLKDFIADLSLARTTVGDQTLAAIGGMHNLRRLDLSGTRITPAGLDAITALSRLEELRITRTKLDATAIAKLQAIASLKRLYAWNSGLDAAALDQLHTARPDLVITAGAEPAAPVLTEPAIVFSSEEPLPGAPAKAVSLDPINSICPVSGKAIDRKYLVVHQGRVVGFCCEKCASQFLTEPAKFTVKTD